MTAIRHSAVVVYLTTVDPWLPFSSGSASVSSSASTTVAACAARASSFARDAGSGRVRQYLRWEGKYAR